MMISHDSEAFRRHGREARSGLELESRGDWGLQTGSTRAGSFLQHPAAAAWQHRGPWGRSQSPGSGGTATSEGPWQIKREILR